MGRITKHEVMFKVGGKVQLSLKKIFLALCITAIAAFVMLACISIYFNFRLVSNQKRLIDASAIGVSRMTMTNALFDFLVNQENILNASDVSTVSQLNKITSLDKQFKEGLNQLYLIANAHPGVKPSLNALQFYYQQFLVTDQQLLKLVQSELEIKSRLKAKSDQIDEAINTIITEIAGINGILELEAKKVELQIKTNLQNQTLLDTADGRNKFKLTIAQWLTRESYAQKLSNHLNTNLIRLSAIMRQAIQEENTDNLTNLKNNDVLQIIRISQQDLAQLSDELLDRPELFQTIDDVNHQFKSIESALIETSENIFLLRISLNNANMQLKNTLNKIQKTQKILFDQFNMLKQISLNLQTSLLNEATRFSHQNQMMIITMLVIVLFLISILSYYLMRAITTTIDTLINAMKKIANEEESLNYRLPDSPYEDLNEVSHSFNAMTNKLQYIYGHLQDLVDTKTQEIAESRKKIILRHEIVRALIAQHSTDEVMDQVLKIISEFMQCPVAIWWDLDKENNRFKFANSFDLNNEYNAFIEKSKKMIFPIGQDLPGQVGQHKITIYIEDIVNDPHFLRGDLALQSGFHAAFAIPITFKDKVISVIEIFSEESKLLDNDMLDLLNDVGHQISVFIEREEAQNEIKLLSRQAGMSEVATSILHNVGNTLNSVKTSATMLRESTNNSFYQKFSAVVQMLKKNSQTLPHFLTEDEKGKLLPDYLIFLMEEYQKQNAKNKEEAKDLLHNIDHIETIVEMQQPLSGVSNVNEKIYLDEAVNTALKMCQSYIDNRNIHIQKELKDNPLINTDKSKLLQILVNLIRNAAEALTLSDSPEEKKDILLKVKINAPDKQVTISVKDNGVGIAPENLERIFSFGFTTKPDGHGFGLHSSALAAQELGGNLTGTSEGIGKGATFILTLPLPLISTV